MIQKLGWIFKYSRIPVILVIAVRLGCLNHALLTQEVLLMHGIECAGWVANCLDPDMLAMEGNLRTLGNKLRWPCIKCFTVS